jgi:hypothetical protein
LLEEAAMSAKRISFLVALIVITTLNLAILALNLSVGARATVAGMDYKALYGDADFRRAVTIIIQGCQVTRRRIEC